MDEIEKLLENMKITRVDHLPIVATFCRRVGLVGTINPHPNGCGHGHNRPSPGARYPFGA